MIFSTILLTVIISFNEEIESYRSLPLEGFVDSLIVLEQNDNLSLHSDTLAYVQYLIGRYAHKIDDYKTSILYSNKAIDTYQSYGYKGYRLWNSHNDILKSAIALDSGLLIQKIFKECIQLSVQDQNSYRSKSVFLKNYTDYLVSIGEYTGAIDGLESYINTVDHTKSAYIDQAWILYSLANYYSYYEKHPRLLSRGVYYLKKSIEVYSLSLELDSISDPFLDKLHDYTLATLNLFLTHYDKAISSYENYLKKETSHQKEIEALNGIAYCLQKFGNIDESTSILDSLHRLILFDSLDVTLRNKILSNRALCSWDNNPSDSEGFLISSIKILLPSFDSVSVPPNNMELRNISDKASIILSLRNLARLYLVNGKARSSLEAVAYADKIIEHFFSEQFTSASVLNWLTEMNEIYQIGLKSAFELKDTISMFHYLEKSKNVSLLYELTQKGAQGANSNLNAIDIIEFEEIHNVLKRKEQMLSLKSINGEKIFLSFQNEESRFGFYTDFQDLIKNNPNQLIIIPDGQVNNISFGTLLQDSSDWSSFLERNYTISYQFSATLWRELVNKKVTSFGACIIAPEFDNDPNELYAQIRGSWGDSISLFHLPFAAKEASSVSSKINDAKISSDKVAMINAIMNNRILHFTGHAVTFLDNSDLSFLALGSNYNDPEQKLTLSELYDLESNNEMVVLSACSTSEGEVAEGEGVLSLARGFFHAGAKSVISTLWSINDQSSAFIMTEFYKELKKGKRKDEALRQAKLTYLDQADPEYQHPYYWAAFVAMGDMSPLFFPYRKYKIGGVAICGILILGFAFRKNQQLQAAA